MPTVLKGLITSFYSWYFILGVSFDECNCKLSDKFISKGTW